MCELSHGRFEDSDCHKMNSLVFIRHDHVKVCKLQGLGIAASTSSSPPSNPADLKI